MSRPPPLPNSDPPPLLLSRRSAAAPIWAVVICAIAFLIVAFMPITTIITESTLKAIPQDLRATAQPQISCFRNMKEIANAMQSYARDNDGLIPAKMSDLFPKYINNPKTLVCPDSRDVAGEPGAVNEWSSYACIDEATLNPRNVGMVIREKSGENHSVAGGYCIFEDGRVTFRFFAEDGI